MREIPEGYSRRLIGPNLFFNETGTVLDVPLKIQQKEFVEMWQAICTKILPDLGWVEYKLAYKIYGEGLRLALSAPPDVLLSACDVIDYTWRATCYEFRKHSPMPFTAEDKNILIEAIKNEGNQAYRMLYANAKAYGVNVFRESDEAYVGSGKGRYKVSLQADDYLSVPWQDVYDIPAVIVTGTNGKTTTVRLTHFICQFAGRISGYASTDWVEINGEIIDRGDYSGPTGHQFILTNPQVEVAVLESARGGLLKRGLIETQVSAATVTNVSADHMGEDGVETIDDLVEAKCIVYRALAKENSYAVINLDDEKLVPLKEHICKPKILVSQGVISKEALSLLCNTDRACYVENAYFVWWENGVTKPLICLQDVPLTMNGYARHNIENILHAIALSYALGISFDDIVTALKAYQNNVTQNQGRANVYTLRTGAEVIIDFAHNPAGFKAILSLAKHYQSTNGRLVLMFGSTGDRLNLIDASSQIIVDYHPNQLIIKELKKYLRGAKEGEIPKQIAKSLIRFGVKQDTISFVSNELSGAESVLRELKQGDVCVLCCHDQIHEVTELVKSY